MPSPIFQPYTLAVSKKLIPCSWARSMIAKLSSSVVFGPKFIVPRHNRLTLRPVRPNWVYSNTLLRNQIVARQALPLRSTRFAGVCRVRFVVPAREPFEFAGVRPATTAFGPRPSALHELPGRADLRSDGHSNQDSAEDDQAQPRVRIRRQAGIHQRRQVPGDVRSRSGRHAQAPI